MFVGDELPESLLPEQTRENALLPDDLRVVLEGTPAGRLLLIAAGLLVALVLGVLGLNWLFPYGGAGMTDYAFVAIGVAVLAWLLNRDMVRRRREFRLLDDGITVAVQPLTGGPPRTAHFPWAEIVDYTVLEEPGKAFLHVVSVQGYTLTLKDRPPRPSTREFIRRFVEQADRHPRAVEATPRAEGSRLPDVTGERAPVLGGCATMLALVLLTSAAETFLDLSRTQEVAGTAAVVLVFTMVMFWWDLDDADTARRDAKSNQLTARLRRWMRRVLRIRPT